ncbi:MAG: lipoyl synthase [bacterium]|nr:lipoyl synthase [bacterium]
MVKIPEWIKRDIPRKKSLLVKKNSLGTLNVISELKLNTVCQSAKCPNIETCFKNSTATFMILGSVCTRACGFCGVGKGKPADIDNNEPLRIVDAVRQLKIKHAVITSVTRDDLPDGGAGQFIKVINLLRKEVPDVAVEVLTPDFKGDLEVTKGILLQKPDIFNHNIETVPRLYGKVRPQAVYKRSLDILRFAKGHNKKIFTKSGIMVGLGEKKEEVLSSLLDLRENNCDYVTIGQYFRPNIKNLPVVEYLPKEYFVGIENEAKKMGFLNVFSGTWVRSSFHAEKLVGARLAVPLP